MQIFNAQGEFRSSFSLGDNAQIDRAVNEKNEDGPMAAARIAVDGANRAYVSFPLAGLVRLFEANGAKIADIALPFASSLARTQDGKIVAVASRAINENGHWTWKGGEQMFVLGSTGIAPNQANTQSL